MTPTALPPGTVTAEQRQRAQVIARLRHPNLVRMLPLPAGGGLVPVVTEARRLADFTLPAGTFKRFDLDQVVKLMLDVLSGLSALDLAELEEPFVHGEVCPRYVYVGEYGTAKLVPLTSTHLNGARVEASGYVAPELLLGEPADRRADVFSVGVMLWEALSGRRLFSDPSAAGVVAILARPLPPPVLPPRAAWAQRLYPVVQRALARDPGARHASAVELSRAITEAVGSHLDRGVSDTWQDEAPTPVLKPRLHFPPLRMATPPATVMDVPREVVSERPPPDSADVEPRLQSASAPRSRRRRAGVLAVASVLLLAGLVFSLRGPALRLASRALSGGPAASAAITAPAALRTPAASAPREVVPTLSASALAPVAPATSVAEPHASARPSKALPSDSARAVPRSSSPPNRGSARRRPGSARSAPSSADYGI